MNKNIQSNSWQIVEEGFNPENQLEAKTPFCQGNSQIFQQANFEEYYSGPSILGCHLSDSPMLIDAENLNKSNGKTINAPNWTGIIVRLNEEVLDLASWEILSFKRTLNMRDAILERTFETISPKGRHILVKVKRFISLAQTEIGAITYSIKSLNFEGRISFMPIIDGDLKEQLTNPNEPIWNVLQTKTQPDVAHLWAQTRRTDFHICTAMTYVMLKNNEKSKGIATKIEKEKVAGYSVGNDVKTGDTITLHKFCAIVNSKNHSRNEITQLSCDLALEAKQKGWDKLVEEHCAVIQQKWEESGIDFQDENSDQKNLNTVFRNIQHLDNC